MNNTIRQILKDSYMITEDDNQWIFTNEEGEEIVLSDAQLSDYENYIIDNIESFGYSKNDLDGTTDTFLNDEENMSPKELKLLRKRQKKEAKILKKEKKVEAKRLKREQKLGLLLDDDNLDSFEENSWQEEQEKPNINQETNDSYDETNYTQPQDEQTAQYDNLQAQNDSNNYYEQNAMTNDDSDNYYQNNNVVSQNDSNNYYQNNNVSNQNSLGNYYQNNTVNQNPSNVIQPPLSNMDLTELERQSNDEITKSIISNITATKKSVDSLRKFLQEVKEI